jgi:hypothetical protein
MCLAQGCSKFRFLKSRFRSIRSIPLDRNFVMRTQRNPVTGIALLIDLLNAGPVSPLALAGVRLKDFTDARDCGKSSVRVSEIPEGRH